jgi:hypothetical protein
MRRSTVIFILLFAVLAGAYYYLSNRETPAEIEITFEPEDVVSYLFSADDGIPTSIRIESKDGSIVEAARDADNAWVLKQPIEAAADQGSVEAAASQVTTMRILDTLSEIDLSVVGLDDPEYELTVKFDGVERNVSIGVITPTGNGYYVLDADGRVVIVTVSAVDGLLNLFTNPPYLETPIPSPTATETPIPASPAPVSATPATTTPQP